MAKGFKRIVPSLVAEKPGLTSTDYARLALERGLVSSNATDPVFSLSSTLEKEFREGRLPELRMERVDGRRTFRPATEGSPSEPGSVDPDGEDYRPRTPA